MNQQSNGKNPKEQRNINDFTQRWYDESFVKSIIEAYKLVPDYQKEQIADRINIIVESVLKSNVNHKVNTSHHMNLGRFKEYNKRRWYDSNANVLKSVKNLHSLINQPKELQKRAMVGLIELLGDHIKLLQTDDPTLERPVLHPGITEEPTINIQEVTEEESKERKKAKIMISGEKLSLKRDTPVVKNKNKKA